MVQLSCDCACAHLGTHGCAVKFPVRPAETSARDLRVEAAGKGWEVLRGTKGRDVCPACRIAEIRDASGVGEPTGGAR